MNQGPTEESSAGLFCFWASEVRPDVREGAVALLRQSFAEGRRFLLFDAPREPEIESLRGYAAFDEFVRPKG